MDPTDARRGLWVTEMTSEDCFLLIGRGTIGRLCQEKQGAPMVLPAFYASSQNEILLDIIPGPRPDLIRDSAASFEVDSLELDGRAGWTVVAQGQLRRLTNPTDLARKLSERETSRLPLKAWMMDADRGRFFCFEPTTVEVWMFTCR